MEKKVKAKSGGIKPALIAVAASAVFWSILAGAGVLNKFEYRIYDALLAVRPIKEENPNLALVEIDDASLDKLGPWPWSRDIIADVLLRLREAGAKAAVFDIEYLRRQKSPSIQTTRSFSKKRQEQKKAPKSRRKFSATTTNSFQRPSNFLETHGSQ